MQVAIADLSHASHSFLVDESNVYSNNFQRNANSNIGINFESEGEKSMLNVERESRSSKAVDLSLREMMKQQSFDRKSYSTQPVDKSRNSRLKTAKTELTRKSVHDCYANDTAKKNTWSRNIIFHKSAARLNLDSSLHLTMTKIGDPPASSLDEDEYPNFGPKRGA